jgi:apolipoprotein N-acyltransferase
MKRFAATYRDELVTGALGGALMALSFPPFPTRVLACVALVPLFRYFYRAASPADDSSRGWGGRDRPLKRGFLVGYSTGIVFFIILLYWISNLIPASSARMPWLMVPAVVVLTLYLSLYPALFSLMLASLTRRWGRIAIAAAPALWALTEIARSRGELGFSWGILASSLAIHPEAIQGLSLYGPFGLSLVLVLVNLLIATALFHGSRWSRTAAAITLVIIVAGHLGWGTREMDRVERERSGPDVTVAVVQPNVDLAFKWKKEYRDSVFSQIDYLTREAAGRGAGLVIFPETSAPISFKFSGFYRELLRATAFRSGVDLLIGHIDHEARDDEWRSFNAASLFQSDGTLQATYGKVNLLPFGERIPFSQYMPMLGSLDFGQANFLPGERAVVFESAAGRFGVLICFESTFSHYARDYVRDGADFLVNITNDGWFGSRRGALQHAETAILRAVENRVTLYRSANTGVSLVAEPTGRVPERIGLDVPGMILHRGYRLVRPPFYTRHGHLLFTAMAALSLAVPIAYRLLAPRTR